MFKSTHYRTARVNFCFFSILFQGNHWLLFMLLEKETRTHQPIIEFFDSLGQNLESYDLQLHPFINSCKLIQNPTVIQSPLSSVCGDHCLRMLYHRLKGRNMLKIIHRDFSICNLKYNDWLATKFSISLCLNKCQRRLSKYRSQSCKPCVFRKY